MYGYPGVSQSCPVPLKTPEMNDSARYLSKTFAILEIQSLGKKLQPFKVREKLENRWLFVHECSQLRCAFVLIAKHKFWCIKSVWGKGIYNKKCPSYVFFVGECAQVKGFCNISKHEKTSNNFVKVPLEGFWARPSSDRYTSLRFFQLNQEIRKTPHREFCERQ